jgi:trimeric autotransporter adhesin
MRTIFVKSLRTLNGWVAAAHPHVGLALLRAKTTAQQSARTLSGWVGVATARPQPRLAMVLGTALALLVVLTVSAQAETLISGSPSAVANPTGPIRTHSNGVNGGEESFSISCDSCHVQHDAAGSKLLRADGAAVCATCHDANDTHRDSATQQSVTATSGDCFTCHPHSAGFMPVSGAVSLTVSKKVSSYDDLDTNGSLSPGDRVHYRIDYGNPGPEEVTGVALRDEPDTVRVASVEAITDGGAFDGTAIQWNVGALGAGATGAVTYDTVLSDISVFGGDATSTTDSSTTISTSAPVSPASVDVANTAILTADSREPVSTSVTISVVVSGPPSTTSTTVPPVDADTTTTAPAADAAASTTSTTVAPGYVDVNSTAVLSADNRQPVSTVFDIHVRLADTSATTSITTPEAGSQATAADSSALTISGQALGYDDLDADGSLSPGDRVHYRIDYANPAPEDVTGVTLRDELDTAYVASVEAISDGGIVEETAAGTPSAVRWNIGTLAAGASGFVAYDAVLKDAVAFGGSLPTTTTTTPLTTDTVTTTTTDITTTSDTPTTTDSTATTVTTDSTATTVTPDTTATTEGTTTTTVADVPTTTTSVPLVVGSVLFGLAGTPAATRRFFVRRKARRPRAKSGERQS